MFDIIVRNMIGASKIEMWVFPLIGWVILSTIFSILHGNLIEIWQLNGLFK